MKQVLFVLLAFISFQGFSQESVKVQEIGLEVMTKDLGHMSWKGAKKACADLGDGWRLPTLYEWYKIYEYRDEIGGFGIYYDYWSSSEYNKKYEHAWYLYFAVGRANEAHKSRDNCVRAVRDL